MRRFTSLLLGLMVLFAMAPGVAFAANVPTAVATADALKTALADPAIETIVLTADIDTTEQLTVSRPVTIDGAGKTVKVTTDLGKVNGSKHALLVMAGTESNPVVITDLTIDSDLDKAYGVNTYNAAVVQLNSVTIKNSRGAGLTVNGSNVTATELTTSGNAWGAVNVDPGVGVVTPSVFTLMSGNLGEATKIWSDGRNVTPVATVDVDASSVGYVEVPTGTTVSAWTLARTINVDDAAGLIAAIRDLRACDTIELAAGTYDVERELGDMTFGGQSGWYLPVWQPGVTIKGAGVSKTTLTSSVESPNGAWASQDFISIWANGVTIDGVRILSKTETNKAIEVMGKNFTLKNTTLLTNPNGPDIAADPYEFSGSIYFNPQASVAGVAGDVGTSRLEDVFVESAWVSASKSAVTTGTISLKGVTIDWINGGYAPYVGYGLMSSNPAVFQVESDVRFVVDNTLADLNGQVLSRLPKGAVLEFQGSGTTWDFPDGALEGSTITTFSPGVAVRTTLTTPLRHGIVGVVLDFAHSGSLPANAMVKVFVGKDLAGMTFDAYDSASAADPVQQVTIDAGGNATLSINKGDEWYLYEHRELATPVPPVTPVTDKVAPAVSHSVESGTGNGTFTIGGSDAGSGFSHMAYHIDRNTAVTVAVASASFTIKPGKHTVTFWGFDKAGNKSALQTVTVMVKGTPNLTLPKVSAASAKRMQTITMSGKVGHADVGRTRVSFVIQRRVGNKWVAYKTVRTTLVTGKTSFSAKTKLAKRGTFRVRTTHASDAVHVSGVSKWKTFRIR